MYQSLAVQNVTKSVKLEYLFLESLLFHLKCREDEEQTSFLKSDPPPESARRHNDFQQEGGVPCVVIETAF